VEASAIAIRKALPKNDKLCGTIDALCSGSEYNSMIALTKKIGYQDALAGAAHGQQLAPDYHKSGRVMIHSPKFPTVLWHQAFATQRCSAWLATGGTG